jgi:4Fe-4S ferredoxin
LFELKKGTNPITVYEKLPKNNCKECGEEGCYAFGVKRLTGEKEADQCPNVNVNELKRMLSPITI